MLLLTLLSAALLPYLVLAGWGFKEEDGSYLIDSGDKLVINVSKRNGDIISLLYDGTDYQGYSTRGKYTQVESGLGESQVSIKQYDGTPGDLIKVSVLFGAIKHWIVMRRGENNVYFLTNKGDNSFRVQRYIVRFKPGIFPNAPVLTPDTPINPDPAFDPDYFSEDCAIIEAGDICKRPNGHTHSKHYSGLLYGRVMDFDYVGKSNGSVGMWMIRSNHEKASGSPFFRSLQRRGQFDGEDLYDIYWYSMGHTDSERFGLQGPSILSFTDGGPPDKKLFPSNNDYSFLDTLEIDGWVPVAGRGKMLGEGIAGMKPEKSYVVALSNLDAQYWGKAVPETGAWTIEGILPGTYNYTVYKEELGVHSDTVEIKAGQVAKVPVVTVKDPSDVPAIWRIADWDGTPADLLNFETRPFKLTYMHPSDGRLAAWTPPGDFVVGESKTTDFPAYIWKDINNGRVIRFKLEKEKMVAGRSLRVGITQAYQGARPHISINKWKSPTPPPSKQGDTRSLTVGTYRGNNEVMTFDVPETAWDRDGEWQVLTLNVNTGKKGEKFLSGGISIDCIELL